MTRRTQQPASPTTVRMTSDRRIPQLDGIRGLAILSVVIWHYAVVVRPSSPPVGRLFLMTWSGVDLFFVLSGFLIGGILLDNREANNYYQVFYSRRILRIFPLYFLWLFIFIIILNFSPTIQVNLPWLFTGPLPLWSYATYMQNVAMAKYGYYGAQWLAVTWSLAVEEQFYLILPVIIRKVQPKYLLQVCLSCIIVAPLLRIIIFYLFTPENGFSAAYILLPCRIDILFLGLMCAYVIRQPRLYSWLQLNTRILYAIFGILSLGSFFLLWTSPQLVSWGMTAYGFTWLSLLYACLLLITVTEQTGPITWVLSSFVLRRLGIIAYGIYIFHQAVSGVWHGLIAHQAPQLENFQDLFITLGAFACTLLLASLSWQFFEKRFVAYGHTIVYRK